MNKDWKGEKGLFVFSVNPQSSLYHLRNPERLTKGTKTSKYSKIAWNHLDYFK